MDMKLEMVVLPVGDVDRTKAFYRSAGFLKDIDYACGDDLRVVRFTPHGSGPSIIFGRGISAALPGSAQGLQLVVGDIEVARSELIRRGVDVSDMFHDTDGVFYRLIPTFEVPGPDPARRDNASFARFSDPAGNGWVLQEALERGRHR